MLYQLVITTQQFIGVPILRKHEVIASILYKTLVPKYELYVIVLTQAQVHCLMIHYVCMMLKGEYIHNQAMHECLCYN